MPPNLLLVDDGLGAFGPLTDLRPVFDLRTGGDTTRERVQALAHRTADALIVPQALAPLLNHPAVHSDPSSVPAGDWLVINGRWSRLAPNWPDVAALAPGQGLRQADGQWLAARVAQPAAAMQRQGLEFRTLTNPQRQLLERPWHILDEAEETLTLDALRSTLPDGRDRGVTIVGDHPVHIAPDARFLSPAHTLILAQRGPVVIGPQALVGAMTVIEGPSSLGAASQITHHTSLRPVTSVGPACRIAGEVSASIIQGYTNKAHVGYIGHTLLGEWVNLGADTHVSNLKNTYGNVRVRLEPHTPEEDTARTFQGPIVGDFVRTAIGTRLLTGSCVGTGAMIALSGFPPKLTERFRFLTDAAHDWADIDRTLDTFRAMMARRDHALSPALEQRLRLLAAHASSDT